MEGTLDEDLEDLFPNGPLGQVIEIDDDDDDDELFGPEDVRPASKRITRPSLSSLDDIARKRRKRDGGSANNGKQRAPSPDSDDEVQPLMDPPQHLKKLTNRDNPINLADSDEDPVDAFRLAPPIAKRKPNPKRIIRPVPKRRIRFADPEQQPVAGPSRHRYQVELGSDESDAGDVDDAYTAGPRARRDSGSLHIGELLNQENLIAGPSKPRAQLSRVHSPPPRLPADLVIEPALASSAVDYERLTTAEDFLPHVLAILPDLDPAWALVRLKVYITSMAKDKVVASMITDALDQEGGYPRADNGDVNAARIKTPVTTYADLDHRKESRAGLLYAERTIAALQDHFPLMPAQHITNTLGLNARLYFPTFWALREHAARDMKPYAELKNTRASKGAIPKRKEKGVNEAGPAALSAGPSELPNVQDGGLFEWLLEHEYLEQAVERDDKEKADEAARQAAHAQALAEGGGVECGCCFGDELVEDMFQCTEGHLFCKECCVKNAETKLGEQAFTITCMDMSNCSAPFPETELARALSAKSLDLYFRLKIAAELVLAGIEGLETCPACDYAVVIDNPEEKLFVCMAEGCKQVSCRKCRRKEHLPKSCEEMEADRKLDKRHAIEDAMTAALVRKCPKCGKAYLKDSGCNKIICSGCRTMSCYICQQAIKDYSHFDQNPRDYRQPRENDKCRLWDQDEALHDQEAVVRARDAARLEVERAAAEEGIQLGEQDLHVAAPERPAPGAAAAADYAVRLAADLGDQFAGLQGRLVGLRAALDRPHGANPPPRADRRHIRAEPADVAQLEDRLQLARENARNAHLRARAAFEDRYGVGMARDPGAAAFAALAARRLGGAQPNPGILRAPAVPAPPRLPVPPPPQFAPVLPRLVDIWDFPHLDAVDEPGRPPRAGRDRDLIMPQRLRGPRPLPPPPAALAAPHDLPLPLHPIADAPAQYRLDPARAQPR